jgi:hypothetical protein
MSTATERAVACRVLDFPPLATTPPGHGHTPCWLVEVVAETARGPVTTLYVVTFHGTPQTQYTLWHREGQHDPYTVTVGGREVTSCDCAAATFARDGKKCKHRLACEQLLSEGV